MGSSYNILLAEDDQDDQQIARDALEQAIPNMKLQMVNNGVEALEHLQQTEQYPDIFITDIQMPQLTGLEVLKLMKTDPKLKQIPVVILSTSKEPTDITQAKMLGAVLYLTKPYLFSEWVSMMGDVKQLLPVS